MTSTERELKLALPVEDLVRLQRLRRLGGPAGTAMALRTVYFDTADRALDRAGIAVRVRHRGRARIHCVKLPGSSLAGLALRREWEVEAAGDQPQFEAFPPGTVDAHLDIEGLAGTLHEVFATEIRRVTRLLDQDGSLIELAFDRGRIVTPNGTEAPVSELELELKGGAAGPLFDLALAVVEAAPAARPLIEAKSARGYRLAAGDAPQSCRATRFTLPPAVDTADAFAAIVQDCVGQWLANVEVVLSTDDAEGIHQMRVALRRLRSAFRIFRPVIGPVPATALAGELSWLAGALGPARDWDVFVAEVARPAFAAAGADPRLDAVEAQAAVARDAARQAARAAVADSRASRLALELGRFVARAEWWADGDAAALGGPAAAFAQSLFERQYRRLRKAGRHIGTLDMEALHGLRIKIKRLRYAIEFFGSLYPAKAVKRLLGAASALQDDLGRLNDLVVARRLVGSLGRADARRAFAEGVLVGTLASDLERSRRALKERWAAFLVEDRFWT